MKLVELDNIEEAYSVLQNSVHTLGDARTNSLWYGRTKDELKNELSKIVGNNGTSSLGSIPKIKDQLHYFNMAINRMEIYREKQVIKTDLEIKLKESAETYMQVKTLYNQACITLRIAKQNVIKNLNLIKGLDNFVSDVNIKNPELFSLDSPFASSQINFIKNAATLLKSQQDIIRRYDCYSLNAPINIKPPKTYNLEETINFQPYANTIISNIEKVLSLLNRNIKKAEKFLDNIDNFEDGKEVDLKVYSGKREENVEYTIQAGDTLDEIAESYGVSVSEINELNKDLQTNDIQEGKIITIPGKKIYENETFNAKDSLPEIKENKEIHHIGSYKDVKDSNWNINCSSTDLVDLASPLSGTITINSYISSQEADDSYKYNKYVNSGSYYNKYGRYHQGTDFKANSAQVYSISDGVVISSSYSNDGGGNMVVVLNEVMKDDGTAEYYITRYQHLSSSQVKQGDIVKSGQKIAISGSSGGVSPHLHVDMEKTKIPASALEGVTSSSEAAKIAKRYVGERGFDNLVPKSGINLGSYYTQTEKVHQATRPTVQ